MVGKRLMEWLAWSGDLGDKTEEEEEIDDHDVRTGNPIERDKVNDGPCLQIVWLSYYRTTFPNDITGVVRFIYLHRGICSVLPAPAALSNEDGDKTEYQEGQGVGH